MQRLRRNLKISKMKYTFGRTFWNFLAEIKFENWGVMKRANVEIGEGFFFQSKNIF